MRRGVALVSAVIVLSGCGGPTPETGTAQSTDASHIDVAPLWNVVDSLRNAAGSMQTVSHISRSGIDDSASHVVTSVFSPKVAAPGGAPIVVLGHQAIGTSPECAPSSSPDMLGLAPTIEALLNAGYAVSVPDYQGLSNPSPGADGPTNSYYPYLDSTTAAYNMVDAAQSAHTAVAQTSTTWLAMGTGVGGQAAWAANELVDNYGYQLSLAGSVSVSPTTDADGLVDAAQNGTLTDAQKVVYARFVAALHSAYPDDVRLDDLRRGTAVSQWDALLGCRATPTPEAVAVQIPPADLQPAGAGTLAALRGYARKTTLPQGPAQAPMLVSYGDTDPVSPAAWTDRALDRACALGDVITIRQQPDDLAATLAWINDRFRSAPAPNDCEGRAR